MAKARGRGNIELASSSSLGKERVAVVVWEELLCKPQHLPSYYVELRTNEALVSDKAALM